MMEIRFPDLIKVIRAQAFLRGSRAGVALDMPQKLRFELLHARSGKQNGRVIFGYQRVTFNKGVVLGSEKI
jgi:hypothetical protein